MSAGAVKDDRISIGKDGGDRLPSESRGRQLDRLTQLAHRALGSPALVISLKNGDGGSLASQSGAWSGLSVPDGLPLLPLSREVVSGGEALASVDTRRDERLRESPVIEELGIGACLALPLRAGGSRPVGLLWWVSDRPRNWTDEEISLAEDLAHQVAFELSPEVRSDGDRLEELHRARSAVTDALFGPEAGERPIPKLLGTLCQSLGWEAASAWMAKPDGATLHCGGFWFNGSIGTNAFAELYVGLSCEIDEDMLGQVLTRQEPVFAPTLSAVREFPRAVQAEGAGFASGLWLPIIHRSTSLGVIELLGQEARARQPSLALVARSLGIQIGDLLRVKGLEFEPQARWPRLAERLGPPASPINAT